MPYLKLVEIMDYILGPAPLGFEFINYILACVMFLWIFRLILSPFLWVVDIIHPKNKI